MIVVDLVALVSCFLACLVVEDDVREGQMDRRTAVTNKLVKAVQLVKPKLTMIKQLVICIYKSSKVQKQDDNYSEKNCII